MTPIIEFRKQSLLINFASEMNQEVERKVLHYVVVGLVKGQTHLELSKIEPWLKSQGLWWEIFLDLIGFYTCVLKFYIHSNKKDFRKTMFAIGFTESFVDGFPLRCPPTGHNVNEFSVSFPVGIYKLSSFKWRVDISFYCRGLPINVSPHVIFSFLLNGRKYIVELNLYTFNRLRYHVSLMFKEMQSLKDFSCMKGNLLQ